MDLQFDTPADAFRHFLENWKYGAKPGEVQEAKYALEGKRKHPPGARRIKRLLDKYAPGKYEFKGVVVFHG
jgi:hypothetical protein